MMTIDQQTIERVKDSVSIVDVVGMFITLHKAGSGFVGVCPFHADSHPSMRVDPSRKSYKCYACGAGGDVFDFLQRHENMSFSESVEWCASKSGIPVTIKDATPEDNEKQRSVESARIAMETATRQYQLQLGLAKTYLISRGYVTDDELLAEFRIGYAADGNTLMKAMFAAGYTKEVLQSANLIAKGTYSFYDVFRDRVVFPFMDLQGRVCGYSGRILQLKENAGKYLNTNDTILFRKGDFLFGLYQAKRTISDLGFVYLVEGQFDVLSMHAAGVKNTVAGSGTALTPKQIQLITRFSDTVVLAYDGDKAGLSATLKNCRSLLASGCTVKCVSLPEGKDPDEIAREQGEKMKMWLQNRTKPCIDYLCDLFHPETIVDPDEKDSALVQLCEVVACCPSETKKLSFSAIMASRFGFLQELIDKKVRKACKKVHLPDKEEMQPGIHGLEELEDFSENQFCTLTSNIDTFMDNVGNEPCVLCIGQISPDQVLQLRKAHSLYKVMDNEMSIDDNGEECDFMKSLSDCYKSGICNIQVVSVDVESEDDSTEGTYTATSYLNAYVMKYSLWMNRCRPYDRTNYIQRCVELIACAEDSVRIVNLGNFTSRLGITKTQINDMLRPMLARRKARVALSIQRSDDDYEDTEDENGIPAYVSNNERYKQMLDQCMFYPKLNKDGDPIAYIFKASDGKLTQVADFFMEPLLHIQSDDPDQNKRVLKINRRYYKNPLYVEVRSKSLLKKSTIEEELILLEAVNFTNGEDKHWTKIKEWMSRNFVTCTEIKTYGNQQTDGFTRKEDQQFFAFANGIYHQVDGRWQFTEVNELGVASHNNKNYYLPAYSNIYAGSERDTDKYELISTLTYKEIPAACQCTFEHWADLMSRVYKINDNGKWAILFSIMCAFRSNIHCIDRLFTAPFFMGPMSSGKTQIAISIRSLFISPKVPIFNLNIGTDAAMSTMMSTFRDVPIVLDEYNNKDISDVKFQALKGIVYDGDGRQKRKGTSGKEIENDKVYAPVVICGQETPQRDDNALMSRIIVCEVPKPLTTRTKEETDLFDDLKSIEETGLSNVLLEILRLRPIVMDHFRTLKMDCYNELKNKIMVTGEADRLMKTASLFLATLKLIETKTELRLPFTYEEFFPIACQKIKMQLELITKTDKLAVFFRAMDALIDGKSIIPGREFDLDTPTTLTIKDVQASSSGARTLTFDSGTRVLFLRVGKIYTKFAGSLYNSEYTTQSTIEQNLRSHPSFLGAVNAHRFVYYESTETPRGGFENRELTGGELTAMPDTTMVRKMEKRIEITSCIALNYEVFRETYDIDLQRNVDPSMQDLPNF